MEILCFKCGINPRHLGQSYCIECRRAYQTAWMQNWRAGLPTRAAKLLSSEEKKRRLRKRNREYEIKRYAKQKEKVEERFGTYCRMCGNGDALGRKRLFLHRKDGMPHKWWSALSNRKFDEFIESDDYIKLCYECHKLVHGCMKFLNMTWSDIEERME